MKLFNDVLKDVIPAEISVECGCTFPDSSSLNKLNGIMSHRMSLFSESCSIMLFQTLPLSGFPYGSSYRHI